MNNLHSLKSTRLRSCISLKNTEQRNKKEKSKSCFGLLAEQK